MTPPRIPGLTEHEQALLYEKLNTYNQGRASYKEAGVYLVVFPRAEHPTYSLWIYSPLPERQSVFFLCELVADVHESLRMASTLCFYSERRLLLVEYNAKRMQSRGEDLIPVGKYRGHYLHEILSIDPAYLAWLAFKFQPRIPKQERFVLIARIYYAVYIDVQRSKIRRKPSGGFLGKEGEKVENLTLMVTGVRIEDNPYKTHIQGGTPFFYVRQLLRLKDTAGNCVSITVNARTASRHSCVLPAMEHAYQAGETVKVASAHIARTYMAGSTKYTRLTHVKWGQCTKLSG